jgi:GT2 family glycosyltransferase
MNKYDLSVIIVNWNSGTYLKKCLKSILDSDFCNFRIEVIVIDNNSSDNSLDLIEDIHTINLIRNPKNLGFGAACNQGVESSEAEYILFLNPDVVISKDVLCHSLQFIKNNIYTVIGIKQIDDFGKTTRTCARKPRLAHAINQSLGLSNLSPSVFKSYKMTDWNHEESSEVDHVIGSFYLISRKVFNEIKGFDENFFLYYEDYDLSTRLRNIGKKIFYWADEYIYHKGGGSSQNILAKRLFLSQKSKLLFFKKHFSLFKFFIYFFFLFFIEFFIRILASMFKLKLKELPEIIKAYSMLIKSFKKKNTNDN